MVYGSTGGSGGVAINITSGALLPSTVVDNQIFIVTSTAANEYYITLDQPLTPASGDVWVQIGSNPSNSLILSETNPFFDISLIVAYQYQSNAWENVQGYVGQNGVWTPLAPAMKPLEETSWSDINLVCSMGMAEQYWAIGDSKTINLNTSTWGNTSITVQIIGFNHDDLASGSGKAAITFCMSNLFGTKQSMYPNATTTGNWGESPLRTNLQSTVFNSLPSDLSSVIKTVQKSFAINTAGTLSNSNDTLFLLSVMEVLGIVSTSEAAEGTQYAGFVNSIVNKGIAQGRYWTRSRSTLADAGNYWNFNTINSNASTESPSCNAQEYIRMCFCV